MRGNGERGRRGWDVVLALFPIVAVYAALAYRMRAVPIFDDYHAILDFVLGLRETQGAGARLGYLFAAQHNEYKLIFEHALVSADWMLTGKVHFGVLIVAGNLMMLGVLWVLWLDWFPGEDRGRRLGMFLPVCYLLFQLNYVENFDWAMCSLQTFPTILFALASLHCVCSEKRRMLPACLFAVLACFSSGNGLLLAPVGMIPLMRHRRWKDVGVWVLAFCVSAVAYLYRYVPFTPPAYDPNVAFYQKGIFFLSFLGGAIENLHHRPVPYGSVVLGVAMIILFVMAVSTRYHEKKPAWFCGALWILLTAVVVTARRVGEGADLGLTLRYKIYSDLLLIFSYGYLASRVDEGIWDVAKRRTFYRWALGAAVLFAGASDVIGYQFLSKRALRVSEGLSEFAADPTRNSPEISISGDPIVGGEPEYARQILLRSMAAGIYEPPAGGEK